MWSAKCLFESGWALGASGDSEKGKRVLLRDVLLLADPQSPSGIVGGRRWLVAKDVNECAYVRIFGAVVS